MNDSPALPLLSAKEGQRLCAGSRALYARMLKGFLCDPTLSRLESALKSADPGEAFLHAHTLKGLSAQLALPALEKRAASLCLLLHDGSLADTREDFAALETCFELTAKEIASFLDAHA